MRQLKSSEVKELREEILKEQNYRCAICGKEVQNSDGVSLDHQHKLNKTQKIGDDGAGLIRGVLCRECNVLEGKIWNNGSRYLQFKNVQERINWLQSLIKYYSKENYQIIHPTEKPKEQNISKRQFNSLVNEFKIKYPKRKIPSYPKSCKLTKQLKELFDEFKISPFLN